MNTLLSKPSANGAMPRGRVATTIRFFRVGYSTVLVGAMLLTAQARTIRCTPDVPPDVVLKVLFRFTRRDELLGEVVSSRDGAVYTWHVLGAEEIDEAA
jgi:hypothetical protein